MMFHFYFVLIFVILLFYIGLMHIIGRRLLVSSQISKIARVVINLTLLFSILFLGKSHAFETNEIIILSSVAFAIFLYLVFLFFNNKDKYEILNSTKEENQALIENYLNMNRTPFRSEGNKIFLGADYVDKIEYTSSVIDLSLCSDLGFKKKLIGHIKTNGKHGSRNFKEGIFIIFFGIALVLVTVYMLSKAIW